MLDDGLGAYPANATSESDEGTYINSNGGVTLGLVSGVKTPDRAVTLMFPPDVDQSAGAYSRTFTDIAPTQFVFQGTTNVSAGIEAMPIGAVEAGGGKVNFVNPAPDGYDGPSVSGAGRLPSRG
jgi:hypothetical protein